MPPKPARGKKDDNSEYVPDEEETDDTEDDSEEYIDTTETTGQPSSRKGKKKSKKQDDGDDNKKSALKNPVKIITDVLKDKKEEITKPKFRKKKSDETDVEESTETDKLLASFPLPSSSRPVVFNPNIALIGAINIQAFGTTKSSNNVLMRIIADILRHYDIILCQEIRAKDDIIQKLCDSVSTPATPFAYVASHPIGRSSYKEKYVFLYRKNEWKVLEDYVIDDDEKLGDKFIREPYVVRFQHLKKSNVRVTLVGCHTQPDEAFAEIKALVSSVYIDVKKKLQRDIVQEKRQLDKRAGPKEKEKNKFLSFFMQYFCCCFGSYSPVSTRDFTEELTTTVSETDSEPIVIMGDLNAAGSYVNKSQRAELDVLLKKNNLIWGIKHNLDTTVADGPDTAYDRFIFEAANERRWIGNTSIWRFDDGWLKGNDVTSVKNAAKRVTDHYPIEFEFKL